MRTDCEKILQIKPNYPKDKLKNWNWELNCLIFIPPEINFDLRIIRVYRSFGKLCNEFPRLLFVDASIWEYQKFSSSLINLLKHSPSDSEFWKNTKGEKELLLSSS
jgi:hypothetical protein